MTQFTNLDIEKNLQYISTSNIMLVIHKWSRKYTYKHSIIKHNLKVSNDVILVFSFIYWKLHYLYIMWHNDNKVIWKFFTHINRLNLHQDNGKNLSTKKTIVVSQDCLKLQGHQWPVVVKGSIIHVNKSYQSCKDMFMTLQVHKNN